MAPRRSVASGTRNVPLEAEPQVTVGLDTWHPPVLSDLTRQIEAGRPWGPALVEAVGRWSIPSETVDGREITYLIAGEAFDWLVLAERLLRHVDETCPGVVPAEERGRMLFCGQLPPGVTLSEFSQALGPDKYRAHLNFFYGVVVEEALWQAVEREVRKERGVRGLKHHHGEADAVCERLYRADESTLLKRFRKSRGERPSVKLSLTEWKEFTYWRFKLRVGRHDSARIASDTRKGLRMLEEIWGMPIQSRGGLGLDTP